MDCTIQADNLPVKQDKATNQMNIPAQSKGSDSQQLKVASPRVVQRTPVGSPSKETNGHLAEFSTNSQPKNAWAEELRSDLYKKDPKTTAVNSSGGRRRL